MSGTKLSSTLIGPIRSISTARRQWSWSRRSIAPQIEIPATFITTSMLPWAAWISAAIAVTAAWSEMSAAWV